MGDSPIGSYFEQPAPEFLLDAPPLPHWHGQQTRFFALGRHALAQAAQELIARDVKLIHLPDFLCSSMLAPFERFMAWRLYPLTEDLLPETGALDLLGQGDAVLVCNFFGRDIPSGVVESIRAARARGATVVSDLTHAPFEPAPWRDDLTIISLRKTLPIPDGAIIMGHLLCDPPVVEGLSPDALDVRSAAAREKYSAARDGGNTASASQALSDFERYLETVATPAPMSDHSITALASLDTEALARARIRNAATIVRLLNDLDGLSPLPGYGSQLAPAYVTCRTAHPRELQTSLARQGVYCPIHWPRPTQLDNLAWRNDLISLPIDHRYDSHDMERIARCARQHFQERK